MSPNLARPPGPDGKPGDDAVGALLKVSAVIPRASRKFTIATTEAQRRFGLTLELLTEMVALGFPVERRDGTEYFESSDLINLSLYLRTGTNYRTIGRFWPRALRALEGKVHVGYRFSYVPTCPVSDHAECRFRILTPSGEFIEREGIGGTSSPVFTTEIWLRCDWPELPPLVRSLINIADRYELTWLPAALRDDTDFMADTGLASCKGLAKILTAEGRKRGVEVRQGYGLLTSPPYASIHFWAEAKVDDLWIPIDPLMIAAMVKWNLLDPASWSPYRSLGGILCRLALQPTPVVTHDSQRVDVSFPISRLE